MQTRWERLAPLTGLIAVAIIVVVFAVGGDTPDEHASATEVQTFYSKHHDKHTVLAFILAISIPFLVFFASSLRNDLRRAGGTAQLANAAFGGGVLAAAGFGLLASVHLALTVAAEKASTLGTAQTLNVLDSSDFIPAVAGFGLLVLAAGASVVRHGGLPRWLGWIGIVLGVATFTPAGFFAFLAGGVWILIASVLLTQARGAATVAHHAEPPAT